MMNQKKNPCIVCSVEQCAHHMCSENFCTLDQICVDTHEAEPSVKECVDCASFEKRSCC